MSATLNQICFGNDWKIKQMGLLCIYIWLRHRFDGDFIVASSSSGGEDDDDDNNNDL